MKTVFLLSRYRVFLGKRCVAASAREGRAPGRAKVGRRLQLDCVMAAGETAKTKTGLRGNLKPVLICLRV